ncbi:alanine racemase [Collimonas fungivorans]|uniref:Alanine racemase n=1 Tax=Collimonas fungivorans (strain Ter331) TaxID=1005048 RepID=G0AEB8_COLFT|nr:alanine racemase [Collimonas fungivorans]AEK64048.1 Alanine racemase [Collimonas fungivorans Ter331]
MQPQAAHAGAILTVDLGALRSNYRLLRKQAGSALCGAAVKADAYGLGAARVGPALAAEGCRHFFVAHLDEGIALRPHLPATAQIFVLHGPPPGAEQEFISHGLLPVLNSLQQIQGWHALAQMLQRPLPAIVQVDSGMSRMGLPAAEAEAWLADPRYLQTIPPLFLMSHLACAEHQDHPMNASQLARFNTLRQRLLQVPASLANSSGIFLGSDYQFDLVRPGAALYGIAPVAGAANPLQPVAALHGRILQTRSIERGDHVGYGISYSATEQRQIATVGVGYADGWLRGMSNRGLVFIDGRAVPMVGTVSMDSITIDVTGIAAERLQAGALVELIGPHRPVDDVARLAGTIGYEILTGLGHRYHREYIGGL